MKKIKPTNASLLLILFIIGIVLCSLGTIVAFTEWQDVKFIDQSEAKSFFQMKTVEKTVKIDADKAAIFLNNYYYESIVVDEALKDDEIKVICSYNPERYKEVEIASSTEPENNVQVMVGEQFDSYAVEMVRDALSLLKEKKVLVDYRDFEVKYVMNSNNKKKVEKGYEIDESYERVPDEVETTEAAEEDGISYEDTIEENGETVERRLYEDGRIIYIYPDGTEKEVSPDSTDTEVES